MSDDIPSSDDASLAPPPSPPPPPPAAPTRRHVLGRKGAAAAVAGGLVVGGVAGGYVISQAATSTPSATATPSAGSAPNGPRGGPGFGGDPAAQTTDQQQTAAVLGITTTQLQSEVAAGKTVAAIAKEHNVGVATVISTLVADENKEIDAAVSAGTITSAQATQMKANTTQRVTDMVNGTRPTGGFGHGGPGGPGGAPAEDQQVIATASGITTTQLQTELSAGKTIAAIATEHNATAATVINALVASENAEIDKNVSSGQITAAQGAQEKSQTQQRVTDLVNGTRPAGGPWGQGGFRGGPPPNAPPGTSSTN